MLTLQARRNTAKHLWTKVLLQVPGVHSWDFFLCSIKRLWCVVKHSFYMCVPCFKTALLRWALVWHNYQCGGTIQPEVYNLFKALNSQSHCKERPVHSKSVKTVMQGIIKHSGFEHCLLWTLSRRIWVERCFPSSFLYLRQGMCMTSFPCSPYPICVWMSVCHPDCRILPAPTGEMDHAALDTPDLVSENAGCLSGLI